jgi:FlaA1/EpsC-like NDP-sugar epimerase
VKSHTSNIIRFVVLLASDLLVLILTGLWAIFLTIGRSGNFTSVLPMMFILVGGKIVVAYLFRVYNISLRYCSLDLLVHSLSLFLVDFAVYLGFGLKDGFATIPSRLAANLAMWNYIGFVGYRVLYRLVYEVQGKRRPRTTKRVIIYGVGECGKAFIRHEDQGKTDYEIIGVLDDDPKYYKRIILGRKVLGTIDDLEKVYIQYKPDLLIVAISSGISAEKMQKLAVLSKHYSVDVKLAPSMFELSSSNHKSEMDLRSLDYPDLLGRPLISIDRQPILDMIQGKRVMVTGAGGSIGSEICRQLKSFHPAQLLLLDIDETELHDLSLELHDYQQEFSQDIFPICCDIKNKEKIDEIFRTFKPQIVFHAAAYKHVPMMELYPEEAIRTNIPGSYNIMTAAKANHAEKVIVISTDKAVNPTNVMGATKRVVEMEAALLTSDETPIVCVRFGNVLGSRGSMLPLFFQQIKAGVPITVTDKNIIRYFMAIPEAVGLVFRAGAMGNGGEVMVLDMGEPVKIYDFAEKLIDIYGDKERNKIIITGLRPGEKLYEELLANKDNTIPTTNKRIFKAKVTGTLQKETFEKMLSTIEQDDTKTLLANLNAVVPEYTPKPCKSWESYTELA